MGKLSQQQRGRKRMTQYNIAKAVENYSFFVQCKVKVLEAENLELSKQNENIRNEAEKDGQVNKDKIEKKWSVPLGIVCMLLGCLTIYSILFSTGYFIYGQTIKAYVFLFIGILLSLIHI